MQNQIVTHVKHIWDEKRIPVFHELLDFLNDTGINKLESMPNWEQIRQFGNPVRLWVLIKQTFQANEAYTIVK